MKILLETTEPQALYFIPREYPSTINYVLTNESTNTVVNAANISTDVNGAYMLATEVFDLKEDTFYNIDINKTDGTLIYRGRIFCTNQNTDKFTMNEGEYIEDDSKDNEYIIYNG